MIAKALKFQDHTCGHCGLKFADGEDIHLHHLDGNHDNGKPQNLQAIHSLLLYQWRGVCVLRGEVAFNEIVLTCSHGVIGNEVQ